VTLLSYVDHLQRKNSTDLAFYPLTTLEAAIDNRAVLTCDDNGEPAGYLWHGPVRSGRDVVIYQACVDYESRRRHLGWSMVADLIDLCRAGAATGIRLRAASSSDSNDFWSKIGFYCTLVSRGGGKRSREINHWRMDVQAALFTVPPVEPSTKEVDWSDYNRRKRDGEDMPSRFSRSHYK